MLHPEGWELAQLHQLLLQQLCLRRILQSKLGPSCVYIYRYISYLLYTYTHICISQRCMCFTMIICLLVSVLVFVSTHISVYMCISYLLTCIISNVSLFVLMFAIFPHYILTVRNAINNHYRCPAQKPGLGSSGKAPSTRTQGPRTTPKLPFQKSGLAVSEFSYSVP